MIDGLMGEQRVRDLLRLAIGFSGAEQTEAAIWSGSWALTRFANSGVHQNMAGRDSAMQVRAVFGKKIASAMSNRLDEDNIRHLVERVVGMARLTDDNQDFRSLPEPDGGAPRVQSYFDATGRTGPDQRAEGVRAVAGEAELVDGTAAGSYQTRHYEQGVMNSLGIDTYYSATAANLVTVVTGPEGGFGYASAASRNVEEIHPVEIGAEAAYRAKESRNPLDVEPGEYECVLMPYAVCDMLGFLGWMGFGAMAYQEGRSFVCGKMGQRIVSEKVSIWDDGGDPRTMAAPFDAEGVAKQRVDLIRDGVASGLLYSSYTAHREGKKSTGHAYGGPDLIGCHTSNLIMQPGEASVEQMIADTKRGILVTRFHYTNIAHLMTATITGMTRDGTFLIENGKITGPVKNLRFTQSVTDALNNLDMVGKDTRLEDGVLAPAIKVSKFRFSSATQF